MDEVILDEVKLLVGIYEDDLAFNKHLALYINGLLSELGQMHVGPPEGFSISHDSGETWGDFIQDQKLLGFVKTFVVTKATLRFNTPASAVVVEEMHKTIEETVGLILTITDRPEPVEEENQNEYFIL